MDIEARSLKYVEYHMFETFDPIFLENTQTRGLWHDDDGLPRYESVIRDENGNETSILFPVFDPESEEYDTYNYDK
tara:strand:+ start:572 stop:799 length:228 start_codon:yes stop_codon:yes gene_type:complete